MKSIIAYIKNPEFAVNALMVTLILAGFYYFLVVFASFSSYDIKKGDKVYSMMPFTTEATAKARAAQCGPDCIYVKIK